MAWTISGPGTYEVVPTRPLSPQRMVVRTGPTSFAYPASGADVDGIIWNDGPLLADGSRGDGAVAFAIPGMRAQVEAGGAFSNGASLVTDATGRAVAGSGKVVLRALEASSGAGAVVWAVFTSGR